MTTAAMAMPRKAIAQSQGPGQRPRGRPLPGFPQADPLGVQQQGDAHEGMEGVGDRERQDPGQGQEPEGKGGQGPGALLG